MKPAFYLRFIIGLLLLFTAQSLNAQWAVFPAGTTQDLYSVAFSNSGNSVWLGGQSGIAYSFNGGSSFSWIPGQDLTLSSPIIGSFEDIHAFNATTAVGTGLFFLGNDEVVYRTVNSGSGWTESYLNNSGALPRYFMALAFKDASNGVLVGNNGRIMISSNAGQSWSSISSGTTALLNDVKFVSGSNYVAVGDGVILRSSNNGNNWSVTTNNDYLYSCSFSGTIGYAVGSGSDLYKTTDGGFTWTTLPAPSTSMNCIFAKSADSIYAGASDDLYFSSTGGVYWDHYKLPGYQQLEEVEFDPANGQGIAVGQNGYSIRTLNNGGNPYPLVQFVLPASPVCAGNSLQFTNQSNPAYSYQWDFGGQGTSSAYNGSFSFSSAGNYDVRLVATGINGQKDTLVRNLTVLPAADVVPFNINSPDTVCPNTAATFIIPASQNSVWYQLRNGFTNIGSLQVGNGGTLSFTTGALTANTTFNILGYYSNGCSVDSFIVSKTVKVLAHPALTITTSADTICYSGTATITVQNSLTGFNYNWTASPGLSNPNAAVAGTGGTITLSIPSFTSTRVFTVNAVSQTLGCTFNVGSHTITIMSPFANLNFGPNPSLIGQAVTFNNTSSGYNRFYWNFGTAASPSTYLGSTPPPVTYNSAYHDSISLIAVLSDSICYQRITSRMDVLTPATTTTLNACLEDSLFGGLTVTDMYLDEYNSKYLTGYIYINGSFNYDFWAAKVDSAGHLLWKLPLAPGAGDGNNFGMAVTADKHGNAYVSVVNRGTRLRVEGYSLYDPNNILCIDPDGHLKWYMSSNNAEWTDLLRTPSGTIYTSGNMVNYTAQILEPDGDYFSFNKYLSDTTSGGAFIMGFDDQGNISDFKAYARTLDHYPTPVYNYISFSNNFNVGGSFSISNQYRTGPLLSLTNGGHIVITALMPKLNSNRSLYCGNVIMNHYADFDSLNNVSLLFNAEYDPSSGEFLHASTVAGSNFETLRSAVSSSSGEIYIAAHARDYFFRDAFIENLDATGTASQGPLFNVIVKTDVNGTLIWYARSRYAYYHDMELVDDTSLWVLSTLKGQGGFYDSNKNSYGLASNGSSDVALVKFSKLGAITSIVQKGVSQYNWGCFLEQDACGNLYSSEIRKFSAFNYPGPVNCPSCNTSAFLHLYKYPKTQCGGFCFAAYNPQRRDAVADSLYLSSDATSGLGQRSIYLKVRNYGQVTATALTLGYSINNGPVQTINWNGTLNYTDTLSIQLANYTFSGGPYFHIRAWIAAVNGSPDNDLYNDSLDIRQIICPGPLSGTYTIDSGTGSFDDFSSSALALKTCGISGPVDIRVSPGVYEEQLIVPVVAGSSVSNTITWESANGDSTSVVLKFRQGKAVLPSTIYFDNYASNILFQRITVQRMLSTTDYDYNIVISDSCHRVSFLNNRIEGILQNGSQRLVFEGNLTKNNLTRFENNHFSGGWRALELAGDLQSTSDDSTFIISNVFDRQTEYGIRLYKMDNTFIRNNRFIADSVTISNTWGALYANSIQQVEVNGNTVISKTITNASNGLFAFTGTTALAGQSNLFANNIMLNHYRSASSVTPGLYIFSSGPFDIYHNTLDQEIKILSSSTGIRIVNNILRQSGYQFTANSMSQLLNVDYNTYFKDTSLTPYLIYVGASYYTFSDWKNSTGFDQHSTFEDVNFTSWSDYHVASSISPRGTPLPSLTTDLDGDSRSAYIPFIGADEFNNYGDVWPGDANNDNVVDNYDILPLGFYFGSAGNPRAQVSNTWQAWTSNDWGRLMYNGENIKFSDCNGDGMINFTDTLAINYLNFGLTHRPAIPQFLPFNSLTPEISVVPENSFYDAGDTIVLRVYGGTSSDPLQNIYNIAFDLAVDPTIVQPGYFEATYDSCWMASAGQRITTGFIEASAGIIHLGISRINQLDTTGYGLLAKVMFVISNSLQQTTGTNIGFTGYQAYNANAVPLMIGFMGDSITCYPANAVQELSELGDVKLYPNPATESIHFFSTGRLDDFSLTLCDLGGRQLLSETRATFIGSLTLPVSNLAGGTYMLIVQSAQGRKVVQIVKQ